MGHTCVSSTDTADPRRLVDSLKAVGVDMLKLYNVSPAMYLALAAEARRVGLPFGGHAWDDVALTASDSGARLIDHLTPWSGDYETPAGFRWRCWAGSWPGREMASVEPCRPVAEQFRRNNTWLVPTLSRNHFATGEAHKISARFAAVGEEFWDGVLPHGNWLRDTTSTGASRDSLGVLRVIQAVGLPIVVGTDVAGGGPLLWKLPPGFALHYELAVYVAEGLTPLNALQSATLNPAKMWRATDSLGTVAQGKLADLVLLDADPLADITNTTTIRAVVANGRYFDRVALDSLLAEVRAKAKQELAEP
jgi:hypothetical protein